MGATKDRWGVFERDGEVAGGRRPNWDVLVFSGGRDTGSFVLKPSSLLRSDKPKA